MSELDNDFFNELMKDTGFVMAKTGSLMSSRMKVETPLYVLNCIYGGGIPLGIISELSGPPASGKSTFSYQCMGKYQKQYPDGVAVIYDMESSMDDSRLQAFGVDTERLLRLPATSMEDAFSNMFKILNKIEKLSEEHKNISSFQIYDSISSGGTEKQHTAVSAGNSAFGAGTMMEAPRIIKQNLSNVFPYLEKFPVFLGLLNQVFTQLTMYTSKLESGGGMGLKHLCHSHIAFGKGTDVYDHGFLIGTESMISLNKSKLSPKFIDIPCYIDVTRGGVIDEVDSFVKYLTNPNVAILKIGSWYQFSDGAKQLASELGDQELINIVNKNQRKNDMYALIKENKDLTDFLQIMLIEFINGKYPLQKNVNFTYLESLVDSCKYYDKNYFKDLHKEDKEFLQEGNNEECKDTSI